MAEATTDLAVIRMSRMEQLRAAIIANDLDKAHEIADAIIEVIDRRKARPVVWAVEQANTMQAPQRISVKDKVRMALTPTRANPNPSYPSLAALMRHIETESYETTGKYVKDLIEAGAVRREGRALIANVKEAA